VKKPESKGRIDDGWWEQSYARGVGGEEAYRLLGTTECNASKHEEDGGWGESHLVFSDMKK
jgi:hypothetical protein